MSKSKQGWLSAAVLLLLSQGAHAGEREDIVQLHNTTLNLIKLLVQEGVLSKDKAETLIKQAETSAAATPAQASAAQTPAKPADNVVRVPYVPQIVRDEIRDQVKRDVLAQAKTERWGDPGALPDWLSRVSWSGDLRARAENDFFQSGNDRFVPNYVAINQAGNLNGTNTYLNTTTDRRRWLLRARLNMNAQISERMKVGMRLSSGTTTNPVSTNSTLGTYENRSAIVLDQAYLDYQPRKDWQVLAGKMPNPWLSTDLVWDDDINFDGLATRFGHSFASGTRAFGTLGAFPVQEVDISANDKWLYAGQLGLDYQGDGAHRARVAVAYYGYKNIAGVRNAPDSNLSDFTAPVFAQKGNTYYNIADPANAQRTIFGLASDYRLIDIAAIFDVAQFGRARVSLTGDYVKNLGFDANKIFQRANIAVDRRDVGYLGRITVGVPEIKDRNDWQVFGTYRYLEGDAVPDAFTDSDFHLGGTNAKGWILGANYGIEHNTWLTLKWLSADEIDGPPLAIDVLQLDLNTRF